MGMHMAQCATFQGQCWQHTRQTCELWSPAGSTVRRPELSGTTCAQLHLSPYEGGNSTCRKMLRGGKHTNNTKPGSTLVSTTGVQKLCSAMRHMPCVHHLKDMKVWKGGILHLKAGSGCLPRSQWAQCPWDPCQTGGGCQGCGATELPCQS